MDLANEVYYSRNEFTLLLHYGYLSLRKEWHENGSLVRDLNVIVPEGQMGQSLDETLENTALKRLFRDKRAMARYLEYLRQGQIVNISHDETDWHGVFTNLRKLTMVIKLLPSNKNLVFVGRVGGPTMASWKSQMEHAETLLKAEEIEVVVKFIECRATAGVSLVHDKDGKRVHDYMNERPRVRANCSCEQHAGKILEEVFARNQ
jgi:hypothetical protein